MYKGYHLTFRVKERAVEEFFGIMTELAGKVCNGLGPVVF